MSAKFLSYCPECGAEPGCNIDCDWCISLKGDAACILAFSSEGKILGVSRKDNPNDFGMPGGKVDPGESPKEAALRELEEETGLFADNLNLIYVDRSGSRICWTYTADVMGVINTSEKGRVKWIDPSILLKGSFEPYNRKLFALIGLL